MKQKNNIPTVSFAITVCNELTELKRLIDQLIQTAKPTDEIVIQIDENNTILAIRDLIESYQLRSDFNIPIKYQYYSLNRDFAEFKNKLKEACTKDFIFQIDADEYLGVFLQYELHELIQSNPDNELFFLTRINTVSDLPIDYARNIGWKVDHKNFYDGLPIVNWPDVQGRIFKNVKKIKWAGKVHEKVTGHKKFTLISNGDIDDVEGNRRFSLIHQKTFEKQAMQNSLYMKLTPQ